MEFELIRTPGHFLALADDWADLCRRAGRHRYSQQFDWAKQSWQHVAEVNGWQLAILVGREQGRACLIWPLLTGRRSLWRYGTWLGPQASEYSDILVEDSDDRQARLEAAWKFLKANLKVDYLEGRWIRPDAAALGLVEKVPHWAINYDVAPLIDLTAWPDWDSYYSTLKNNYRREQRRILRRLGEMGEVTFGSAGTDEEVDEILNWMFIHKQKWQKREDVISHWVASNKYKIFLVSASKDALRSGNLALLTLRLNGNLIAASLSFTSSDQMEALYAAYDRALYKFAPGKLIGDEEVKWAYQNGVKLFDYRMGAEDYKFTLAKDEVEVYSYLLACSFFGNVYCHWRGGPLRKLLIEQVFNRLPKDWIKAILKRTKRH